MVYEENPTSLLTIPLPIDESTNLPIPMATSSIDCQLASQNTEEMLVACYYPDATPEDLPVISQGKDTEFVIEISCGTAPNFCQSLDIPPLGNNIVRGVE